MRPPPPINPAPTDEPPEYRPDSLYRTYWVVPAPSTKKPCDCPPPLGDKDLLDNVWKTSGREGEIQVCPHRRRAWELQDPSTMTNRSMTLLWVEIYGWKRWRARRKAS
jgi:hypothetical protein